MKSRIATIALLLSCAAYGFASGIEVQGTIKQDDFQGSFKTEKAVVTKIYFVESEGASFRAYVVSWNNSEVVISDMPSSRKKIYNVGDTIRFMVHRIGLKREGASPTLSFMLMPDFEMPNKEQEDGE